MTTPEEYARARQLSNRLIGRSVYEQDEIIAQALREAEARGLEESLLRMEVESGMSTIMDRVMKWCRARAAARRAWKE